MFEEPLFAEQLDQDRSLAQQISYVLQVLRVPALRRLQIEVRHGVVTLTGVVGTFYQRHIAHTAVHRISGILYLILNIEVEAAAPA